MFSEYNVAGHCCIAGDVLTVDPTNPEKLSPHLLEIPEIGDLLVIERAGGYCASMAIKNFNSFPDAIEVVKTVDGKFKVIKKKQTLEQICQNELSF
jgi:diaminopimelate decarboxylase